MQIKNKNKKIFLGALAVFLLAAFLGVTRQAQATEVGAILLEVPDHITVTPDPAVIHIGGGQQFTAVAYYTCAPEPCIPTSPMDITNNPLAVWSSDDPGIVSVDASGLATGNALGDTNVNIVYGGVTGSAAASIVPPLQIVDSVVISPSAFTLDTGMTSQLTATVKYRCEPLPCIPDPDLDVTNSPLTNWASGNALVASVSTGGLVVGVSPGGTTISATYDGVTGNANVFIVAPAPEIPPVDEGAVGGAGPDLESLLEAQAPTQEETQQTQTQEFVPPEVEVPPETETTPPTIPGPPPPGEEEYAPSPEGQLPPPPGEVVPEAVVYPEGTTTAVPGEVTAPEVPPEEETILQPEVLPEEPVVEAPVEEVPPLTYEEISPMFLPPELSVTREEITTLVVDEFAVEETKEEQIDMCLENVDECLSIFESVSNYDEITLPSGEVIEEPLPPPMPEITFNFFRLGFPLANAAPLFQLGKMQLFPDLPPSNPRSYQVNLATLLAAVHGYYEEPTSPFKPNQTITRIEATKVILGTVDMLRWLFYDELEAISGGLEGVKAQTTPFSDIVPTREYMWWYPRYVNKACEVNMVDCRTGTKFRPDDYITEAEVREMIDRMKKYIEAQAYLQEQTADPDGDTIKTYLETSVFFTDPYNADTDGDKLRDDEELFEYRTSPFLKDSDSERLDDYQEVKIHKTNPLNIDTDGDGFNDYVEVMYGSDPLDPNSTPYDRDNNKVVDEWETKFGLQVRDGMQDTDSDGLSDKLEFEYGTNPLDPDSDRDGFTDAEELLDLRTDPNDPNDPGTLDRLGVRITNFTENQLVGDNTPMIKGVAPLGSTVRIVLRNDYGHEKVLGDTWVDENNIFIFQQAEPIRNGRYMLAAKALEPKKKRILISQPIHIIIDSTLNVLSPVPKKLADQDVTEDVILRNVRLEIKDRKPVLVGETEFGNRVTATWRSVVTTSALIADAVGGEFSIAAPKELALGKHEVYVQATRKKDNAQSDTIKILFNVGVAFPEMAKAELKPAAEAGEFPFPWLLILILLAIAAAIWGYYYYRKEKEDRGDAEKTGNGENPQDGTG